MRKTRSKKQTGESGGREALPRLLESGWDWVSTLTWAPSALMLFVRLRGLKERSAVWTRAHQRCFVTTLTANSLLPPAPTRSRILPKLRHRARHSRRISLSLRPTRQP